MSGAATHALHDSRADKAFAIVALWSREIHNHNRRHEAYDPT
jgi:hypothetical protein